MGTWWHNTRKVFSRLRSSFASIHVGILDGPLAGPTGGCLRSATSDGCVECWGGMCPQSVLSIEAIETRGGSTCLCGPSAESTGPT